MFPLRALAGFQYCSPPRRPISNHPQQRVQGSSGASMALSAAIMGIAYETLNSKEEKLPLAWEENRSISLCRVEYVPSLKEDAERKLIAALLAGGSDESCRHLVYHMIRVGEYDDSVIVPFLVDLVIETLKPEASAKAKEDLHLWVLVLKIRNSAFYKEFLKNLDKAGFLPGLFTNKDFQKDYAAAKDMDRVKADYFDFKKRGLL